MRPMINVSWDDAEAYVAREADHTERRTLPVCLGRTRKFVRMKHPRLPERLSQVMACAIESGAFQWAQVADVRSPGPRLGSRRC